MGPVVVVHRLGCSVTGEIFWIRAWIHVSCNGRQILYYWATREAPVSLLNRCLLQWSPRSGIERPGSSWFCRLNCLPLGRPTHPFILSQQLQGFIGLLHVCYCTSQHPSVVGSIFYPHFIDLLRFRDIIISLSKVDQTNHSNMSFYSEPLCLVPVKWNKNTHFTAHKVRSQEMIMQIKAVLNEKNLPRWWLAF